MIKEIWNIILKFLLSKTTLDEEIAAKADEIDDLDETKIKKTEKL